MEKARVYILIPLLCSCMIGCSGIPLSNDESNEGGGKRLELTPAQAGIVESANQFGFNLFREINRERSGENVFVSPLSVSLALGMTYNGADGETEAAMRSALELPDLPLEAINEAYRGLIEDLTGLDPDVQFEIANSIWYRLGIHFQETFIDLNATYFGAAVNGLDFGDPNAAGIINAWVSDKTNDKIPTIINPPVDPMTVMFLINAIYFNGMWTYEFDVQKTKDHPFTRPDGSTTTCRMMNMESTFFCLENDDFQAVDIPYGNGDFSMTVLLPRPGRDIDNLISQLDIDSWNRWIGSFSDLEGQLSLPKFKLAWGGTLNSVLSALGMEIAFEADLADFSGMYEGPQNVFISSVIHKTFVDVNEAGTEAAAVTIVEIGITSVEPRLLMTVDRPFIFAIRETQSGTVLFIGKIVEPIY